MKKLKETIILFLLCSMAAIAQNKTIVPKNGAIVFNAKVTITDQDQYNASKKAFSKKFLKAIIASAITERKAMGKEVDTAAVNREFTGNGRSNDMVAFFESELFPDEEGLKYHHDYKDGKVTQYKSNNGGQQDVVIIDPKTRNFTNDATEGVYDYSGSTIHDIKVLKDQIKMIRNYKCFKVMYTYSENSASGDAGYGDFMSNYKTTREMWVTEQIKAAVHPIVNDKEIISKYYPLEIIETLGMAEGKTTNYEIESCTLK